MKNGQIIIADSRRFPVAPAPPSDPFFLKVSFLTEFNQHILDSSPLHNIVFGIGPQERWNEEDAGIIPNEANWFGNRGNSDGSGAVVDSTGQFDIGGADFSMSMRVRKLGIPSTVNFAGQYFQQNTKMSWRLFYDSSNKRISAQYSEDGIHLTGTAYFRLGVVNDGLTAAQFFDGTPHDIQVSKAGITFGVLVDGAPGSTSAIVGAAGIGPASPVCMVVGSISADGAGGRRVSSGSFKGEIAHAIMTIGGSTVLELNYQDFFSFWWKGKYPHTLIPIIPAPLDSEIQDIDGLTKTGSIVGPRMPYHATMLLDDTDFTLEVWGLQAIYLDTFTQHFMGISAASVGHSWRLAILGSGALKGLVFQWSTDGAFWHSELIVGGFADLAVMSFAHVAVVRFGNTLYFMVDSVRVGTASISGALFDPVATQTRLTFYANDSNGEGCGNSAHIRAVRITKQAARYQDPTYTIPTLPLPLIEGP